MSSAAPKTVIAFDLYGTLLSTESIAKELSKMYGDDKGKLLAAHWRRYQLEYTWRSNSMGIYRSFSEMTRAALKHAVAEQELHLTSDNEEHLMRCYNGLDTFPEIGSAMELVEKAPSLDAFIFSNGTDEMVSSSMRTSPTLSKMSETIFKGTEKLVTVEAVRKFKPDPVTYQHFAKQAGGVDLSQVWLVSSNPFDVVGARAAGARSAWIDRAGTGWVDGLGSAVGYDQPSLIVGGVDEAVKQILAQSQAA